MSAAPARRQLVPIDQVVQRLTARIDTLAPQLLPGGRRAGAEWVCSGEHFGAGTSMAVHLTGAKAGVWKNFLADVSGDALDLVAYMMFGGDKKRAFAWSIDWCGLSGSAPSPAELRRDEEAARRRREDGARETERRRRAAHALWLGAAKGIAGTPVEQYLAGRGIDLAQLGKQPGALRFHPGAMCGETGTPLPAMVTAVCDAEGRFIACHRTWLEQAGPGDWRKARLENAKKVLGSYEGGMIRLWNGASGKRMADAPAGEVVDITEGIEDGLSVVMATPEARVVAAISLSNMGNLRFPPAITTVRIWRQHDTKLPAIKAFDKAVQAFRERGLRVLIPPLPEDVKDVNDLLCGAAASPVERAG